MLRVARPPAPYGAWRLARCESISDVARRARRRLPSAAWAYLEGGAEDEYTLRRNRAAFDELEFLPEAPGDVREIDTGTTVLGIHQPLPFVLSPVGAPRMVHHEGEVAVARAARHAGIPYGISTLANTSVEEVAAQTDTPLWFQLYLWSDREVIRGAIERARRAGFHALVLNIDTNVRSKREREKHAGLSLPRPQLTLPSFLDGALHPYWSWHLLTSELITFPNIGPDDRRSLDVVADLFDGTVCWNDLKWIREQWEGPVVVKGVLRPEEAVRAAGAGADAIVVSNHGGRQLDHVPATIDVLPGIVEAVGDRVEVLVDSGFRRGSDIAAALALGARAVLLGRAHLYGLAAAGEAGVRHCIDILAHELTVTMGLCGVRSVSELSPDLLRRRVPGT